MTPGTRTERPFSQKRAGANSAIATGMRTRLSRKWRFHESVTREKSHRRPYGIPIHRTRLPAARSASRNVAAMRSRARETGLRAIASAVLTSPSDRRPWIRAPEHECPEHRDHMDEHDVEHHRLRCRRTHSNRPAGGGVAVIAADQNDRRGDRHALDEAE